MGNPDSEKAAGKIDTVAQEAVKAETTSRPKREYRTLAFQVALFAAIAAFAVLTFMVSSTPLFSLDLQITRGLQQINSPLFAVVMEWISWPGFLPQNIIIPVVLAGLLYSFGLRWEAVTALVAAFVPGFVNLLVKQMIGRPRPAGDLVDVISILDSYSFPSGHVMFYVGFFGFLYFLAFTILKHSWMRTLLLIFFGSLILFVGVSRIYLGHHWASDILGASLLGGLSLVFILQFYRWGKKRFFARQPVAPG
ncbi:MAG TPA: phosphatase PAP2 family protein [Anaerolineales bacterium]